MSRWNDVLGEEKYIPRYITLFYYAARYFFSVNAIDPKAMSMKGAYEKKSLSVGTIYSGKGCGDVKGSRVTGINELSSIAHGSSVNSVLKDQENKKTAVKPLTVLTVSFRTTPGCMFVLSCWADGVELVC